MESTNKMKVTTVYFSPTKTTKKGVEEIGKSLDENARNIDITKHDSVKDNVFLNDQDVIVFGVPVYGGRIFEGAIKRLNNFKGNNTPCVVVATYGKKAVDDALLELADTVKANGFIPIAGAALIGEHTYGTIEIGRPNEKDLQEDSKFAKEILKKINLKDLTEVELPGNRPYKSGATKGGSFTPLTNDKCISCGLCAKECPMGAIDMNNFKTIDSEKCISCFRCIKICPVGAKNAEYDTYINFANSFTERVNKLSNVNEYFGI
jgi:ferredoxin